MSRFPSDTFRCCPHRCDGQL